MQIRIRLNLDSPRTAIKFSIDSIDDMSRANQFFTRDDSSLCSTLLVVAVMENFSSARSLITGVAKLEFPPTTRTSYEI